MRVAVPNYRPLVYGPLGPVWASLSGYVGGASALDMNWRCARFPVDETVVWGEVEDDPQAQDKGVICRLFRGDDHWALVGARVNSDESYLLPRGLDGQPALGLGETAGPVELRVRGLNRMVESAVAFDVETLQVRPVALTRSRDDLLLSVEPRWFLIILRRPGCRPIVSFGDPPAATAGRSLPLDLRIAPTGEAAREATAKLLAPGLGVDKEVSIPGSFTLEVPPNAAPGRYLVTLSSPRVMGHKRFLEVPPA
jgi:hypothetical protein